MQMRIIDCKRRLEKSGLTSVRDVRLVVKNGQVAIWECSENVDVKLNWQTVHYIRGDHNDLLQSHFWTRKRKVDSDESTATNDS